MTPDPLHRCELCGVLIAEPPEDPSADLLCPECQAHLDEVGIEPRVVST